ncbi:MAG: ATP-binding protein [Propionibacteriaceae bacterium]|nr:ATP-binding protein [Propionibacteriaceae bacterium]
MELVPRHLSERLVELLQFSPVVVVEGARQVGKSTLAAMLADAGDAMQVTMDDPLARQLAREDPVGFLQQAGERRIIIDEVQRTPELVLPLKYIVDVDPRPGRFILTGSANLLRVPGAEDSLAGRALTLRLHPFSQGEMEQRRDDWVTFVTGVSELPPVGDRVELVQRVAKGGYPRVQQLSESSRQIWLRDYVDRLLERDSADLGTLQVPVLRRLLGLIMSSAGGELVQERFAEALGISRPTVRRYLDILESLFLVRLIPAWSRSLTRRQVGRPKIQVTDSGLAAAHLGLGAEHLSTMSGAEHFGMLLECFVVNELLRQQGWSATTFELSHYRDRHGGEVDLIIETPMGIIAVEVKAAISPTQAHFKHLITLRERLGDEFLAGVVLNSATSARAGDRLWALPVASLWETGGNQKDETGKLSPDA